MNAAIFAAPIPVVAFSPQVLSPLSPGAMPVKMNLTARVDLADPEARTSAALKRDPKNDPTVQQPTKNKVTAPAVQAAQQDDQKIVLDGKVDVYV